MRVVSVVTILIGLAGPAIALDAPAPGALDPHIRTTAYNAYNRTLVVGVVGMATTITFGSQERIERVMFGSVNEPWQAPDASKGGGSAYRNNLPLWPRKAGRGNMQVITTLPDGDERLYQFDLVAHDPGAEGADDPDATYGLIFTYPGDVQKAAVAAAAERRQAAQAKLVRDRLATDVFYGKRNWHYAAQGKDRELAPMEVSDNGRLTAFRFPGNTEAPAIYVVGPNGERLAPFVAQDDLIVVQETAAHFRLRLGDEVLEVYNKDFDPVGDKPDTGTTSTDVIREVVQKK
jgi:type IV secretion system protein VirB9